MTTTKRRSGRTFRLVLTALVRASEGEHVRILLRDVRYARQVCEGAWQVSKGHAKRRGPRAIEFENGGFLVFASKQEGETAAKAHAGRFVTLVDTSCLRE